MARRALTVADRAEITTGLKAGWSIPRIAEHLGRDRTIIWREIKRNSTMTRGYRLVTAHDNARQRRRRPQLRKIAHDPVLATRVLADLKHSRTPRQIAGRLRLEARDATVETMTGSPHAQGRTVSHEAIYHYIYAMPRAELARRGIFLQSKRTRRKPRGHTRSTSGPIVGMRSIHERDQDTDIAGRRVPGHWEGDLVIGANGASCCATLVERMSRFVTIIALTSKHADPLADLLISQVNDWPELMRGSITWDQGSEMARHGLLTQATSIPVFFADPHSPWQRGSNENTNRLIREYLPKSTAIPDHQPYLTAIAQELNERPRASLGYLTPRESFQRLLNGQPHVASTP